MATIPVSSGDDLQAAINSAVAGDVLELEAGATFTGNFTLPVHAGTSYITIQSAGTLPASGVRVSPAAAAAFAKIQASAGGQGAITTDEGAAYWQIIGIAFPGNPGGFGEIITLGNGDHTVQTSTTQLPHHLILDRCYIYGDSTDGQKRGVGVNCGTVTIQNCYISDCKLAGQDAQAIAGWNGPGPFLIDNNYLEGSAENVLFGGGTAASVDMMPANLTFTNNTVNKPTSWRSTTLQCKNLLELKMMATAVIDSNTFTNNWANAYSAGQSGFAVLFTVRNEEGLAPFANITDVQFTRNTITGAGGGISVLGTDDRGSSYPSGTLDNLLIRDNLFTDIAESWGGSARFLQINHGGTNIVVDHNTCLNTQSAGSVTIYLVDGTAPALVLQNNILVDNGLCVFGTNGMAAGSATLVDQAPGYTFTKNVLIGGSASGYPAGNYYPATTAAVGFVDLGGGDYALDPTSAYYQAGTDGDDIGARLSGAPIPGDPPDTPNTPSPATSATSVDPDAALTWIAAGADTYDVAFGTTNPPPVVSSGQAGATYTPGAMARSTVYYWQITARNTAGSVAGPVWSFTTAAAAPSNISAATATDIGTTFPYATTQDVVAAGTCYTVWYKYTAQAGDNVISVFGWGDASVYKPTLVVWIGAPGSQTSYLGGFSAQNLPAQMPVTPGTTYYFQFVRNSATASPAVLTLSVVRLTDAPVPVGSIAVNDDTVGLPLALASATADNTVLRFVQDINAGENGDILADGTLMLDQGSDLTIYDANYAVVTTQTYASTIANIRGNRLDRFYVLNGSGVSTSISRLSKAGAIEMTTTGTLSASSAVNGIAANPDDTICYFGKYNAGAVGRWDMVNDVALSDFITGLPTNSLITDLLCLPNGSVVIGLAGATDEVRIYLADGTLHATLTTTDLGLSNVRSDDRFCYDGTANVFWFRAGNDAYSGKFYQIDADGTILATRVIRFVEGGVYQAATPTATPDARFGVSFSCPFWVTRIAADTGGEVAAEPCVTAPVSVSCWDGAAQPSASCWDGFSQSDLAIGLIGEGQP